MLRPDEVKIKVLFLASNPLDKRQTDIQNEVREIEDKIRDAEGRSSLEFIPKLAVRPDDVIRELNIIKPHIVHISGHGRTDGIVLLDEKDQSKLVRMNDLKELFSAIKDNIQIVFFSNCYSTGTATAVSEVIDCVIGMNTLVSVEAATVFSASFYRALGFCRSVQQSVNQGKAALGIEGLGEQSTVDLKCRDGIDPSFIYPLSPYGPHSTMPERLKNMVEAGKVFIDISKLSTNIPDVLGLNNDLYFELKLKNGAALIFHVFGSMKVSYAAGYLAEQMFPERAFLYNWTLKQDEKVFEPDYQFKYTPIDTNREVFLQGYLKKDLITELPSEISAVEPTIEA